MKKLLSIITLFFYLSISDNFAQKIVQTGHYPYDHDLSSIWGYTAPDGKEYAIVGTVKGTSIVDISAPSNPKQIYFLNGPFGYWREIKTWKNFAYIVHDNSSVDIGVTILDLKDLNNIKVINFKGPNNDIINAHTLYIDEKGFLYLFGGTKSGCSIFDLNSNPTHPAYMGFTSTEYIHDGFVRGDTLWASNIYQGYVSVWNLKNRHAPVKITQFFTPGKFTHNTWLSDDSQTLFTTDEKTGTSIGAYDISDLTDIQLLDEFKIRPEEMSIPHNVHVVNDYLVVSHYTEGVLIADASHPENIVEVDKFDTSPDYAGNGFNGCWAVYPYFPSGLIIASDIEKGLYILQPDYKRANRFKGKILDQSTLAPVHGAKIMISSSDNYSISNFDGAYKTGTISSGTVTLSVTDPKYVAQSMTFTVTEDENIEHDFYLVPQTTSIQNHPSLIQGIRPTQTGFYLNLEKMNDPYSISMYNTQGQLVKKLSPVNVSELQIDWSYLPSGIYFLQVQNGKYSSTNKLSKN